MLSEASSELVAGEMFHAIELGDEWLWGWCGHDHYVGYVRRAHFEPTLHHVTHRIASRTALVFKEPSIKAPIVGRLPLGAWFAGDREQGDFIKDAIRGFVHRRHLRSIVMPEHDHVEVATRLLGAPYLWGGRTGEGIDCSGLVQVALGMCGVSVPRDSDQQRAAVGTEVDPAERARGDLVFFPGHVGILIDRDQLLHANAHWMSTVIEPLADVVDRLRPSHANPVLAVRRL